jgi:autotransporter-associated beta strand protein
MGKVTAWNLIGASCLSVLLSARADVVGLGDYVVEGVTTNITAGSYVADLFGDNGTVNIQAGAHVSVTGAVSSFVGGSTNEVGVPFVGNLNLESGSTLTNGTSGTFYIGYVGGTGVVNIAQGAEMVLTGMRLRLAGNESEASRTNTTYGELNLSGYFYAPLVEMTGFFPNATNSVISIDSSTWPVSAVLNLNEGGVFATPSLQYNDYGGRSVLRFNGGKVLFPQSTSGWLAGGNGYLEMRIPDDKQAVFDTGTNTVVIQNRTECRIISEGTTLNGGLKKLGTGTLYINIDAARDTFTGPIDVEAGTLYIGRPLAQGQTVHVAAGAEFILSSPDDYSKITWDTPSQETAIYPVEVDYLSGLDLLSYAPPFYADRLGGPHQRAVAVSGAITHTPATVDAPFTLIGNGQNLTLTNSTLDATPVKVQGKGKFFFSGERTLYDGQLGSQIQLAGGTYLQSGNLNAGEGLSLTLTNGTFGSAADFVLSSNTVSSLTVKDGGIAEADGNLFAGIGSASAATAVSVLSDGGIKAGTGHFGIDGGNGTLTVNGGDASFTALRLAGNWYYKQSFITTRATMDITAGTVTCGSGGFRITPDWITTGVARSVDAVTATLHDGGVLATTFVRKNDDPIASLVFDGGILRATGSSGDFLSIAQDGTLNVIAKAGKNIDIDTQGYTVGVNILDTSTLNLTGDGGFSKSGLGIFGLKGNCSWKGDTTVTRGTLKLLDDNRIPDGDGYGNLVLTAGTFFDLNGHSEVVNNISGTGMFAGGGTTLSTLGVLKDNTDATWDSQKGVGNVTLQKLGTGTLTLAADKAIPLNLTVSQGAVTCAAIPVKPYPSYQYYRLRVEANKGDGNSMQLSEIKLLDGTNDVTSLVTLSWDTTGGIGGDSNVNAFPEKEQPPKAVDGNLTTKWLDFRANSSRSVADRQRCWLQFTFPSAQQLTAYNWATANDEAPRDPSTWYFEGSADGSTWVTLDVQAGFYATTDRFTWVKDGGFGLGANGTLSDEAIVTPLSGATFGLADGVSETIAGISGAGTVDVPAGSTLVIAPGTAKATTFSGSLVGAGTFVKTGAGAQTFDGANTFAGLMHVEQGTLQLASIEMCKWFRLVIKKSRSGGSQIQASEFSLFDAAGNRVNKSLALASDFSSCAAGKFYTEGDIRDFNTTTEVKAKLFDGNTSTKWGANTSKMDPLDGSTWCVFNMHLADSAAEACSYNWTTANDSPDRDPVTWELDASADGTSWFMVDSQANYNATTNRFTVYNSGVSFPFKTRAIAVDNTTGADIPSPNAVIQVDAGATLDITQAAELPALQVSDTNAGTITYFNPASAGTINILTDDEDALNGKILPLTLNAVSDAAARVRQWNVNVNGVPSRRWEVILTASNELKVIPRKFVIFIR